ncbi:hypothetical protein [Actinomadura rupiterrae]|uniref:hypothetical protein n=1 Tax=Actinomadura rupiterrae TaxID=559627 RepID=UPI002646E23C|nr:hypothetical protein [Actinomadura rupiterrae]MCP2343264.1 FtsP/CotA-like multicopper oxidase with cupredoxin domain [Actinomadura rupiterrae]
MRALRGPVTAGALVLLLAAGCGKPAPHADGGVAPSGSAPAPVSPSGAPPAGAGVVEVRVSVVKGRVVPPSRTVKVHRGATVQITVTSDAAEEFHLHGYDRELELAPGRPGTLRLVASVPGVFEAELHHSGARVFELQVG